MRRLDRKTLLFLLVLGLVIFSLRGSGDPSNSWRAVVVLYGLIAFIVLVKWLVERRGPERPPEGDSPEPSPGNPPENRDSD